ncbi:MAG: hypothetical protein WCS51_05060 [Bacilli bacterium]
MKLNYECLNTILIYLQNNLIANDSGQINSICCDKVAQDLSDKYKYSYGDIYYSIRKLAEIKYIIADNNYNENSKIEDITYLGHQYLKGLDQSGYLA